MIPLRLVLATGNAGKVAELTALSGEWGPVAVESLREHPGVVLPDETGVSYAENAVLKAAAVAAATRTAALADDSGLEVDALDGQPGLRSARWAPTEAARIARLLEALAGLPPARRTARFRCAVALVWPDGRSQAAEGCCEGRILDAASGSAGFGYDPVFWSIDLGKAFGLASDAEKRTVSHRARAMRALGAALAGG